MEVCEKSSVKITKKYLGDGERERVGARGGEGDGVSTWSSERYDEK